MQVNDPLAAIEWLPPYTVRASRKAKRLSLSVDIHGLTCVLPERFDHYQLVDFVMLKRHWILKSWQPYANITDREFSFSGQLNLLALNEQWHYQCLVDDGRPRIVLHGVRPVELTLSRHQLGQDAQAVLIDWLKDYAYQKWLPRLDDIAHDGHFDYTRLMIGNQVSQWGCCHPDNRISLNMKGLFLPASCVNYVMIHELCHTVHKNHSHQFWRLVEIFCPDYKQQRHLLKQAALKIPGWLYA